MSLFSIIFVYEEFIMSCNLGNWDKKCEDIVNNQIQLEYWASYQYHLLWSYFDRSDIGLHNIAEFFKHSSEEEREHAHKLMEYQNLRGGNVKLNGINSIDLGFIKSKKTDVIDAFKKALEMEQVVYKSLLNVHKIGEECNDPQFTDFIEGQYLEEQVSAANEIAKYISQLERIGDDQHGIWQFNINFNKK